MSHIEQRGVRDGLSADPSIVLQGYDTFSAAARSTALKGTVHTVGARTTVSYYTCQSTEQLATNLRISGEVNASFLFGGVDAKAKYVQNLGITETSVVVAVYANVITGADQCTDVGWLEPDALPTPAALNSFYQAYGDSYVSTLTTGAEYIATYVFSSQSIEQQQEVVASLSASGIGESGTVSGSLESAVSKAASSSQVELSFNQTLIGFTNLPLPTQDQLAAFALAFDTKIPDAPEIISFETTGYEHVPRTPSGLFDPIVVTRELFLGDTPGAGIIGAAEVIGQLGNQISGITDVYTAYGYTGDARLAQRTEQVQADRQLLGELVTGLRTDPTRTHTLPVLASLGYGSPSINVSVTTSPYIGNPGDQSFVDVDYQAVLQGSQLTAIALGATGLPGIPSALFDALIATYQSPGSPAHTVQHGEGSWSPTWALQPGEFVSGYEYTITEDGGLLAQMTFTTERDGARLQSLTWPQGLPPGLSTSQSIGYSVPAGSVAVGFAGTLVTDQSPVAIGTLALVLVSFTPATWQARMR